VTRRRSTKTARLLRSIRRVARLVVAFAVALALFAGPISAAAASVVAVVTAKRCHCPHRIEPRSERRTDRVERTCPCCAQEGQSTGCVPQGPGCGGSTGVLAAPNALDALIPLPLPTGIVASPPVRSLDGRDPRLRLERPPRRG
jgi:hypothetical protein